MVNTLIRDKAKARKVKLWQIADVMGITDAAFSRKLRKELPNDEQKNILEIIEQIAAEQRM